MKRKRINICFNFNVLTALFDVWLQWLSKDNWIMQKKLLRRTFFVEDKETLLHNWLKYLDFKSLTSILKFSYVICCCKQMIINKKVNFRGKNIWCFARDKETLFAWELSNLLKYISFDSQNFKVFRHQFMFQTNG